MYQTELRNGISGNGKAIFCLFILDGVKTIFIHRFTSKTEALAFHGSATNYGTLNDQS